MKCPICEKAELKKGKFKKFIQGEYLGEFPALICSACGESLVDGPTMQKIEDAAKKKGVWGLGAKTKITRTGNSLAVRIPKKIVDYLKLEDGEEVYIHPDGKNLVMEPKEDYG
jgi:hypothetical protein